MKETDIIGVNAKRSFTSNFWKAILFHRLDLDPEIKNWGHLILNKKLTEFVRYDLGFKEQ